jgi:hypothetical protein
MNLEKQLIKLGDAPFSRSSLLNVLEGYQRPNDKISRWLEDGTLLSVKKGVYVLGDELRTAPLCLPLVANVLYGPSCVSLESALAHHGWIPEGVYGVASVTTRRAKQLDTVLGRFVYLHAPAVLFPVGLRMEPAPAGGHFLMAGPEKALCDKILLTRNLRLHSVAAMEIFLFEDLRIDADEIAGADLAVIDGYLEAGYKRDAFRLLREAVGRTP